MPVVKKKLIAECLVTIGADEEGGSRLLMNRLSTEKPDPPPKDSGPLDGNPNEWKTKLYLDPTMGLYIPADSMQACLRDAGKRVKAAGRRTLKTFFASCIRVENPNGNNAMLTDKLPLWIGPDWKTLRSAEEVEEGNYIDKRFIRQSGMTGAPQIRYRPCFVPWKTTFRLIQIMGDAIETIERSTLETVIEIAGTQCGLLDGRPGSKKPFRFGRFRLMDLEVTKTI